MLSLIKLHSSILQEGFCGSQKHRESCHSKVGAVDMDGEVNELEMLRTAIVGPREGSERLPSRGLAGLPSY